MSHAIEETYKEVKPILMSWVSHVYRNFENALGDTDELLSRGHEVFMESLGSYDFSRGILFSTYLNNRLTYAMLDDIRQKERTNKVEFNSEISENVPESKSRESLSNLMLSLEGDAAKVVSLVLDPPKSMIRYQRRMAHHGTTRNGLTNHLRGIGWTNKRIKDSLSQVQEALV